MGLFEGLKYYLSGSDSEKSYGKSKSVKQIKKDAVTFSNALYTVLKSTLLSRDYFVITK